MSPDGSPRPVNPTGAGRRVITGLGSEELERELLPALLQAGYAVLERCLAAEQLIEAARRREVQVVLVASDLYRLTRDRAAELLATGKPTVVVGQPGVFRDHAPDSAGWLPAEPRPAAVLDALSAALTGRRPAVQPIELPDELPAPGPAPAEELRSSVITVASGYGSPGRTTVAINLAAALGIVPTVVVDADLDGPSVAAYLDVNPTRNLSMVVHGPGGRPETSRDWAHALEGELQPLARRSPQAVVLCGVPKPEMAARVTLPLFERLLAELQQRYRYVVIDIGAALAPSDVIHRAAVRQAAHVLVVGSGDLPGLWHLRRALALLRDDLHLDDGRLAVVLNRYERRFDHRRAEIEWALGLPLAAIVPYDHGGLRRAALLQQPLVCVSRGPAARALLDLSERVYGGAIQLPPDPERVPLRQRFRPHISLPRLGGKREQPLVMPDGSSVPAVV
jgi:MinD-like ATPase involved in chromosome partitioning or flagellar assembly